MNTFKGLDIKAKVAQPLPGSPEYEQLTWAIRTWLQAACSGYYGSATCENAARELEIERDHGFIVHINRRTA